MSRLVTVVDRAAALLVGIALLALGVGVLLWNTTVFGRTPDMITAPGLDRATDTQWWPWAVGIGGLAAVVLALRWLASHSPAPRARSHRLTEPGNASTATVDLGAVADAAARSLANHPDVTDTRAKAIVERGQRTLDLVVTITSDTDPAPILALVDQTAHHVVRTLGTNTVAVRTALRTTAAHPSRQVR